MTFGNAVTEIAQYAFEYCQRLKKVEFPASLRVIDNDAFNGCTSLQEICFNEGLQVIGDRAFSSAPLGGKDENQKLVYGKLTIPSTVYEMGNYVFRDCTYLEEVSFANGATAALEFKNRSNQYLDAEVFYNCENLKRIYFPNRLKTIPSRVITRCPKLEKLYIPATVEEINEDFLKDCGAKKLTIYGDFNTAAERFATSHKISFKSKQELGIYATSIRLNRTKAVFYGGPSIGRQFVLQAKVLPDTALNKNVVFSSENEQVATVDQEGVVTVTGYGQTLIWAASAEDESIKEACEITVLRVWTEDEVQEVLEYLSNNNEHYLLTNVYGSVGDIELQAPDGVTVEWKEPEEEIQSGVHRYQIRLHKEGYETAECPGFTILGLTVTGVQVEPVVSVQKGKQYPVSVKLLTEGATGLQLQEGRDYQLEWSSANSANVSVEAQDDPERTLPDDPLKAVITGNKVSKNTAVSLKIVFNRDGKAVSVEKKDLGKTWFMATSKVTVCDYAIADGIKVTAKEGEKDIELQALESLYNVPSGQTYELQAQVFADSELIENTALTWKSNNPKVASVKADKTGKAALKIAGKGTALITVTAAKNGGYSYSFRVVVKDSKPRLAQKTVTMNRFRLYTAAEVTLYPSDGYAIDESSLSVVNAKDNSPSIFKIKKIDGDTYEIAMENGDAPKKGTYSLKILAKTSAGEEQSHELPITVKVIEQKPVVTIQQDPINLYEKDGYGTVRIRTDADIESITYTPDAGIGNVRLVAGEVNVEYEYFRFVAENALKDNFAKAANKGTLKVTFNGYRDEIYYESKITLAVNKAPKLVATVLYPTLYPGTAADTTLVFLENTNGTLKGLESNKEAVITTSTPGYICKTTSIYAGYANMTLQALSGAKAGKVAFTVTSEDWYDTVRPQVTCNIKLGKTPALSFSSPVITLNTAYTLQDYDVARVYAYVEGSDVAFVGEKTQFTGKNAQAQAALDDGALSLSMEGGVLQAGIVDADYFKKAGTYAYEMTAYTAEGESVKGSFKIKVVLAKNAPSLSLSAKGQINLLDRDNTYVSLTPKFKNCSGLIQNAKLYGADAEKFRLGMAVDEIRVFAVKGAKLKANTACNLGIRVTLDSDAEFKIPLKITPKQKAPKLTASAKTVTLYETVKGEPYEQKFSIYSQASQGSNIEIEDIRLAQDSDTFGYRRTTGGDGYLYVKDKASVVAGKTYTLKLEVTFKDSAVNMKPSYVTVKVVYNK